MCSLQLEREEAILAITGCSHVPRRKLLQTFYINQSLNNVNKLPPCSPNTPLMCTRNTKHAFHLPSPSSVFCSFISDIKQITNMKEWSKNGCKEVYIIKSLSLFHLNRLQKFQDPYTNVFYLTIQQTIKSFCLTVLGLHITRTRPVISTNLRFASTFTRHMRRR